MTLLTKRDIKQLSSPACHPQYEITIPRGTRCKVIEGPGGGIVVDELHKIWGSNAHDLTHYYVWVQPDDVTGSVWQEITEDRYDDMLNVLPPVIWLDKGFMVGEPWDHNIRGQPRFGAFIRHRNKFYECLHPMTILEFRELNPAVVL